MAIVNSKFFGFWKVAVRGFINMPRLIRIFYQFFFIAPKGGLPIPRGVFAGMVNYFGGIRFTEDPFAVIPLFLNIDIRMVRKNPSVSVRDNGLIIICVVRNELARVRKFIAYYKALGVHKFAFLDDQSNDGTREYLYNHPDVELFESKERYTSNIRLAWINRMLAYYGFDRWFLVLDSDELLVYDNNKLPDISSLINHFQRKNITAISGIVVDMYSKEAITANQNNEEDIYKGVDYFDKTGYEYDKMGRIILGGMRSRCFGVKPWLHITRLIYYRRGIFFESHQIFPRKINTECVGQIALLHYKFLPQDFKSYQERIAAENIHERMEYKGYMKKFSESSILSFFDQKISQKYESPQSLIECGLMKPITE
ncbi:glycosyltransferase family 2 protein [Terrimonas alba]|uniref:glycosyltransferase family 2 protein n=1 Tax=Terrimonas alba TaxID=3349636 RepID=UPI0035F251C7